MKKDNLPKTGEEIEALRIALALTGIAVDSKTACLLNEIFKAVQRFGGKFSISDAVNIQYDVEKRYRKIVVQAVENKKNNKNKSASG